MSTNKYSTFNATPNNALLEPMFFGQSVNVARYDQQKHSIFEKLVEKQISFFWRPEEVDVSRDAIDFQKLTPQEKHIFISNLKYQTLLDSVQGRSPNVAFLPIISIPELEIWCEPGPSLKRFTAALIRTYCVICFLTRARCLRTLLLTKKLSVVQRMCRSTTMTLSSPRNYGKHKVRVYIQLMAWSMTYNLYNLKKKLYLCMNSVNALEAIRFYVSFACTFAFAERKLLEANAKLISLVSRDENLHLSSTQHILNLWASGKDDPEMAKIAEECKDEAKAIFLSAVEQEKEWASYLFKDGSMIGLNKQILCEYIEYIANQRMVAIGFEPPFKVKANPLPWMNNYLNSDNVQVAPQETEIQSYLVGQIDSAVSESDFLDFEL